MKVLNIVFLTTTPLGKVNLTITECGKADKVLSKYFGDECSILMTDCLDDQNNGNARIMIGNDQHYANVDFSDLIKSH
jgi:hypothetical protein